MASKKLSAPAPENQGSLGGLEGVSRPAPTQTASQSKTLDNAKVVQIDDFEGGAGFIAQGSKEGKLIGQENSGFPKEEKKESRFATALNKFGDLFNKSGSEKSAEGPDY